VSAFGQKTSAMVLLSAFLAVPFLFSAVSSFHLSDSIPMEAAPLREEDLELIKRGETDLTTMVTFSIKAYVTPEVVAQYPNYTESVEYLIDILNKQYKRSEIPIMAELHCIEETQTSEAEGMNDFDRFTKYKGTVTELRGSADAAALFLIKLVNPPKASGVAGGSIPPNGMSMVSANNLQGSLHSRILFGHELGHNFGATHEDGFRFKVGERQMGTLMQSAESEGHCCNDEHGFYSNPEVKIDGVATGDEKHNVAGLIRKHRFLVASFGDESRNCGGPFPDRLHVSCGSHEASSCEACPQGNGEGYCNGDCHWVNESCVRK